MRIKRYTEKDGGYHGELAFFCPGCKERHWVYDNETKGHNLCWGFNRDFERPTLTPSVLVEYPANPDAEERFKEWREKRVCHSFVKDGKIQFLADSTHALAGQTVDLPEIE